MSTPVFIPGLELSRRFSFEVLHPVLEKAIPGTPRSAALVGSDSEVLEFDTATRPFLVLGAARITDPVVGALPLVGAIDQYVDSTDLLTRPPRARATAHAMLTEATSS